MSSNQFNEVARKMVSKTRQGATLRGIMPTLRPISRMAPDAESKSTFLHHRQISVRLCK